MTSTATAPLDERVSRTLEHLVSFATESRTPNVELIDWIADQLRAYGASCTTIAGPEGRANLLASIGPAVAGGLVLSGHTDVVAAGSGWASDPYALTIDGARLAGRGTADMKGFIACVLVAVESLDATSLTHPVHIALSYDEEIGCVGVRGLLDHVREHTAVQPDIVVIGEPTMMRPRNAHLGKVAYHLTFAADAGHSSLSPFRPSAITSATHVIAALEGVAAPHAATATRDATGEANAEVTVNVGTISGGSALNVLAPRCEITFELRHSSLHDADALMAPVWEAVERERVALGAVGGGIDVDEITRYPALATDARDSWMRVVERAADRGPCVALGFGTEGGLFAAALDIPVVICGPGDIAVAHRPDEFVDAAQLMSCLAFLRRVIDDVCIRR
ncbi:MAG TPA: acetylornithine deacetylase [Ilumatobacteraceae bacterium]